MNSFVTLVSTLQWIASGTFGAEQCPRRGSSPPRPTRTSVDIELELLEEATTEELSNRIAAFQPSGVHIIAHGRWENGEPRIVLSRRDRLSGEVQLMTRRRDSAALFSASLKTDKAYVADFSTGENVMLFNNSKAKVVKRPMLMRG